MQYCVYFISISIPGKIASKHLIIRVYIKSSINGYLSLHGSKNMLVKTGNIYNMNHINITVYKKNITTKNIQFERENHRNYLWKKIVNTHEETANQHT